MNFLSKGDGDARGVPASFEEAASTHFSQAISAPDSERRLSVLSTSDF